MTATPRRLLSLDWWAVIAAAALALASRLDLLPGVRW